MASGQESVFDPGDRALVIPGLTYNTEGVILARINWTPGTVSAVFAKKGSNWNPGQFNGYWNNYLGKKPYDLPLNLIFGPGDPWYTQTMETFPTSTFRELSRGFGLWEMMKKTIKW